MNIVTLDFQGIRTEAELHEYIYRTFAFPWAYGRNLDALWDSLTCFFEVPTCIALKNLKKLPDDLARTRDGLVKLFQDLEREDELVRIQIEF